ncbi:MAG: DNA-processing protein DprA [Butyricicoccus pullicaecorum]|nr:DNA-processing protein DprA [Butyricicoccus pullicaecorum]
MSGRAYWLWLAAKEELTALVKNQLLDRFGTPEHLYAMSRAELISSTGLTKRQVDVLSDKSMERARAIAYDCETLGISIVTLADAEYPPILRRIPDPPLVLYVKGRLPDLEQTPGIGIVGTRKATPYGLMAAEHFGYGLAKAGCTVVSGMALGADGAAARGALKAGGKTIAVLAGGLNICYPPEHNFLMGDILLSGAVISENPPGTPHDGFRFPIRNRIISGLSRGVLVVEAPLRSGALITARLALDQGREVFAVPGAINAPGSAGCNRLIRDGEAALVTEPRDIIGELGVFPQQMAEPVWDEPEDAGEEEKPSDLWDKILQKKTEEPPAAQTVSAPHPVPAELSDEQKQIVQAVADGADTPEGILEVTDLPASRVMTALTMLELDGVLARENGRIVIR